MKMEEKKAWLLRDNFVILLGFNEIREKKWVRGISAVHIKRSYINRPIPPPFPL